jgi:hypothetical protein
MGKRASPRKKVLMSAAIDFSDEHVNCLINDLSISRAAIEASRSLEVPERFSLVFKAENTHIVWREGEIIGVAFD